MSSVLHGFLTPLRFCPIPLVVTIPQLQESCRLAPFNMFSSLSLMSPILEVSKTLEVGAHAGKETSSFSKKCGKKLGWDGRQKSKRHGYMSEKKKAEQNTKLLCWSSCSQVKDTPEKSIPTIVCVTTCRLQALSIICSGPPSQCPV